MLVAVGQRLPTWAEQAFESFAKRLKGGLRLEIKAVDAEGRSGKAIPAILSAERQRIEAAIRAGCGRSVHKVVLDERGDSISTLELAGKLQSWQMGGSDVALLLGGPDGLDPELKSTAHERIRLSELTLPHALARVLLIEQLYRAWSINNNHPYHRE